ncbi:hypothetical protein WJX73_004209 [Symbiochloris irregularis]|uniref:Uncharacterized protein n=1 Tax=Symbiochloris irregularis TaxID=706552 RepID=A0AAW1PRB7_9CHLO
MHFEYLYYKYLGTLADKIVNKHLFAAVRASAEVRDEVGQLHAVLSSGAPAVLDWLHDRAQDNLLQEVMAHIKDGLQELVTAALDGVDVNIEMFVTFIWTSRSLTLSADQQATLARIVEHMQPINCHEPGWWLWNGETAFCIPWDRVTRDDGGTFARAYCPKYKYPWDRA